MNTGRRIRNILVAFDQFAFSVLTLGWSYPDETLSSAAWRWEQQDKRIGYILRPIIDRIFFFEQDHCMNAHIFEAQRKHAPEQVDKDRYLF